MVSRLSLRWVKARAEKIADPLLRTLVQMAFSEAAEASADAADDALYQTLLGMLETQSPSVDLYLLTAARASHLEDHASSVKMLDKARHLVMGREQRTQLDSAIVGSGLETEDKAAREAATAAALRLRRTLVGDMRGQLVVALEELGQADAAQKLEDQLALQQQTTPSFRTPSQLSLHEKIAEHLAAGKTEEALRQTMRQLTNWAQADLSGQGSGSDWERRQLMEVLEGSAIWEDVLARADEAQNNWRQRAERAQILNILGQDEQAIAAWRAVVAERPDDVGLRMAATWAMAHDSPQAVKEMLSGVPVAALPQMQTMVWRVRNVMDEAPDRVLTLVEGWHDVAGGASGAGRTGGSGCLLVGCLFGDVGEQHVCAAE